MTPAETLVNQGGNAPLYNVTLCLATYEKARDRPSHLPGIVVFYGPSGFGKSRAASETATRTGAYYLQVQSGWTRKSIYAAILKVMGIIPGKTMYEMGEQIAVQLATSGLGLLLDDAQYMTERGTIEAVKDIYESSYAPIMLIGEENLPGELERWERLHGRVLDFAPAQPPSLGDARILRDLYISGVSIADDLLARVHEQCRGSVRRILVNLEHIKGQAQARGIETMTLAEWGDRPLYTGKAPSRRLPA
jgi:hypothetical protein